MPSIIIGTVTGPASVASSIAASSEKTTPVDADIVPITDSEDAGALKWLTLANLWAWVKSKLDAAMTIAGAKSFSGQVELTGQAATNATSAMTMGLGDARYGSKVSRTTGSAVTATSGTAANIPEMVDIPLEANSTYRLTIYAVISTASGGSFEFFFVPTTTQFLGGSGQPGAGIQRSGGVVGGGYQYSSTSFSPLYATQNLSNAPCCGEYYFQTNGVAGTGRMTFAQRVSAVAGTTTVASGATMILEKIS